MARPMSEPWLAEDDIATIQRAVEHLRSAGLEARSAWAARHADAGYVIADRLELIVARLRG